MRDLPNYHIPGERFCLLSLLFGVLLVIQPGRAADSLPFDPDRICRYSLDNIPRSISIRQGADIWFGYDLKKARVFKVWKAPANKPGVIVNSFKAKSSGVALFDDKSTEGWLLHRDGKDVPLTARYLGCVQHKENFELSWELTHPDGTLTLTQRIATTPAPTSSQSQAQRELRIESLPAGTSLVLPAAYQKAWVLTNPDGNTVTTLSNAAWHQLSLP